MLYRMTRGVSPRAAGQARGWAEVRSASSWRPRRSGLCLVLGGSSGVGLVSVTVGVVSGGGSVGGGSVGGGSVGVVSVGVVSVGAVVSGSHLVGGGVVAVSVVGGADWVVGGDASGSFSPPEPQPG